MLTCCVFLARFEDGNPSEDEMRRCKATRWNAAIERYIEAQGVRKLYPRVEWDRRKAMFIKAATMVAKNGGPLYCRCEAKGCRAVEGIGGVKQMQRCSGCKRVSFLFLETPHAHVTLTYGYQVSYCSTKCQKQHWRVHKSVCKKGTHPVQVLPWMEVLERVLPQFADALPRRC